MPGEAVAVEHVFAALATTDHDSALGWYERLFGRPPDLIPNETEAAWQLAGGAWVYIVEDAARAGHGLVTLMVGDLDHEVAGLAERGLAPGATETAPGLFRKALVTDPDGNTIAFAEALSGGA